MFRLFEFLVCFVATYFWYSVWVTNADLHLLGEAQMKSVKGLWLFSKTKINRANQTTYMSATEQSVSTLYGSIKYV